MVAEPITILITDVRRDADKSICNGILVTPARALGFPLDRWTATVLSEKRLSVDCHIRTVERVATSFNEGQYSGRHDNEGFLQPALAEALRAAAANRIEVAVESPSFYGRFPVFISTDATLTPRVGKGTLKLDVRNLSDLPDVQAYIAYGEMMDRLLEGSVLGGSSHTERMKEVSRTLPIQEGQFLPFGVKDGGDWAYGAIHLENELEDGVFETSLLLSGTDCAIKAGSMLTRTVRWEEGDSMCERTTQIGTLL